MRYLDSHFASTVLVLAALSAWLLIFRRGINSVLKGLGEWLAARAGLAVEAVCAKQQANAQSALECQIREACLPAEKDLRRATLTAEAAHNPRGLARLALRRDQAAQDHAELLDLLAAHRKHMDNCRTTGMRYYTLDSFMELARKMR